ncbi:metallophosphoesterase [Pseudaestuariivita rosea]|uniref:metallophosphoesterase n=1 Tax=Pseudaestuariivita rosea TaxID=2763263 RepID=UPI001ABA3188|nr:metallophosphoesterase [Pseudaestuariivita rosea]
MDHVVYAIGDVHGRDDLLGELHEHIRNHHQLIYGDHDAEIVHLGDYIDRGPDSIQAINRLMAGLPDFKITCLLGNHEAMMLERDEIDLNQGGFT